MVIAGQAPSDDFDKDGIPNLQDDCPTDPGSADNGGCPGKPRPKAAEPIAAPKGPARIQGSIIVLDRPIQFESGSAKLTKANDDLLLGLTEVIGTLGDTDHVIVRGHTDDRGRRVANLKLSRRRAEAVATALVARGVPRTKLKPDGVGPDVPIANNATRSGRAKNRRVEFIIRGK